MSHDFGKSTLGAVLEGARWIFSPGNDCKKRNGLRSARNGRFRPIWAENPIFRAFLLNRHFFRVFRLE